MSCYDHGFGSTGRHNVFCFPVCRYLPFYCSAWGADFDAKYAEYKIDDILNGKFHNDFTEEMRAIYNANIIYDENGELVYEEQNPERQGCVAVDARLAELLQLLMDKYSFAGVENSWTKLCYYYDYLG